MSVLLNVTVKCDHAGCTATLQTTASATADVEGVPENSELDFDAAVPDEWALIGKDGAYCPEHIPSWIARRREAEKEAFRKHAEKEKRAAEKRLSEGKK